MFPKSCVLSRKQARREDQPGSTVTGDTDYEDDSRPVRCAIHELSGDSPTGIMMTQGVMANIRVTFPADPRLQEGDGIWELDESGRRTGRGFRVMFSREIGRVRLRYWEATCSGWQERD
jgi:hypothetical protein